MNAAADADTSLTAFGWRRGVAYAVLWSVVVVALETVVPLTSVMSGEILAVVLYAAPGALLAGAVLVLFTAFAVPRWSALPLALAPAVIAALITLIRMAAPELFVALKSPWTPDPSSIRAIASEVYLAWGLLLYGGLFVGGSALAHRAARTQALLWRAEVARSRSEGLFNRVQLASLQGSVDPAFLLRVMDEMQRRYVDDPEGADRLLDHLVGFLRSAMPAVRSGRSTVGAELLVARSYLQLNAELDPARTGWHCDIDGAPADVPFPPLLLLPLLDQLAAAPSRAGPVGIKAVADESQLTFTLHGDVPPGWLADDLLYRLQVGLRALHDGARVAVSDPGSADAQVLSITLALDSPPPDAARPGSPSHPAQTAGASTWT